jgi:hypothetical protein
LCATIWGMAFFDVPEGLPPDLPDEEPRPKPWTGPPLRTVPALLTEQVVLAHTDRVAVVVGEFAVYPTGLTFSVLTVPRRYSPREWAGLDFHGYAPGVTESGELAPELLRYGIEFSDGRRATSLDTLRRREEDRDVAPASPLMRPMGSGGGGGRWEHRYWLWPIPPPGQLAFVCEWPALQIPLTRATLDAEVIRDAARHAVVLWPAADD